MNEFNEKNDIHPKNRVKSLKSLVDQHLFNDIKKSEIIKSYQKQIENDKFLEDNIKFKYNQTHSKPSFFDISENECFLLIDKYNKYHKNKIIKNDIIIEHIKLIYSIITNNISNHELNLDKIKNELYNPKIIWKKKNNKTDEVRPLIEFNGYWGRLLNILFKILLNKIKKIIKLEDNNYDTLCDIHKKLQKYLETNDKYLIFFLDFKKAYDSISRDKIREIMIKYNLEDFIFLMDYLDDFKYNYDKDIKYNKKFGIPQGLPLSNFLFILVIYDITKKYEDTFIIHRYVDDICLIIKDENNYEDRFNEFINEFENIGLYLNREKTYYLKKNINYQDDKFNEITKDNPIKYLGKYLISDDTFKGIQHLTIEDTNIERVIEILDKYYDREPEILLKVERSYNLKFSWYKKIYHSNIDNRYENYLKSLSDEIINKLIIHNNKYNIIINNLEHKINNFNYNNI